MKNAKKSAFTGGGDQNAATLADAHFRDRTLMCLYFVNRQEIFDVIERNDTLACFIAVRQKARTCTSRRQTEARFQMRGGV